MGTKSSQLFHRLLAPPKETFFLFGMRGIGKSTWSQTVFPNAPRIDLLDEGLYHALQADPALFGRKLHDLRQNNDMIVVDEIQRIPSLLNDVHRFIEDHRLSFALLGSSARKLKQAGTNLLAGRASKRVLYPLLPQEMGDSFDLQQVLRFGSLPIVWAAQDRADRLESYVQLYLKEEIQAEALVRNLPAFLRFLPVAALFHGQVINVSGLGRDATVGRTTVEGYLEILEDTLLAYRVAAFETKQRVKERKAPKLYWVDNGVVRAAKQVYGEPTPEEVGVLFEAFVAMLLKAYNEYRRSREQLSYWQAGAREVDFIVERETERIAIEVKAKRRVHEHDFKGLRAFSDASTAARRILIYLGSDRQRTQDGIEILPFADFRKELEADTLFR